MTRTENNILTPPREYNRLCDYGSYFIKSSRDESRIESEIKFYENLPLSLKVFFPPYLGRSDKGYWCRGYKIGKIDVPDQSLIYVGKFPHSHFDVLTFFKLIKEFFHSLPCRIANEKEWFLALEDQVFNRNLKRVSQLKKSHLFQEVNQIFINAGWRSIDEYTDKLNTDISRAFSNLSGNKLYYAHGDLCLSNILIEENKLYLIDPRGFENNIDEGYLLLHYDMAKLSQCLLGDYDFINHSLSRNKPNDKTLYLDLLSDLFREFDIKYRDVRLIESSHFLSMIPLHLEDSSKVQNFAIKSIEAFSAVSQ